jgi:glycosyltransferase involved in cell wall biosynthesis
MRVLTLTTIYPNPYHPTRGPYNRNQLAALTAEHDVRVVSPIAWTDELAARRRGLAPLPPDRRVVCDGIPVEHPIYYFPPRVLRTWHGHFYRWSVGSALERAVAEFRPDVLYAPWAYPDGWAAVHFGRRYNLPVVVKVHGSDVLLVRQYPARVRRTAEALRGADAVIAVSKDLALHVLELGASRSRVRVVYCGVNPEVFHPGPRAAARARLGLDADEPFLLFVGNLVPVKGLDVLIEACDRLRQAGRRFACCLIGQGALRSVLEREVACRGLTGVMRFLGARPQDQLADWYRAADLFVLPSRSEGVPNVLLEARACGTPFVASRVGGIPEIAAPDSSRLVPPEDPARLARALEEGLAGALRPAQRDVPSRSHADAAAELAACFEEVIRSRRPSIRPAGPRSVSV